MPAAAAAAAASERASERAIAGTLTEALRSRLELRSDPKGCILATLRVQRFGGSEQATRDAPQACRCACARAVPAHAGTRARLSACLTD